MAISKTPRLTPEMTSKLDNQFVWHPFTPIDTKQFYTPIISAKDEFLHTEKKIIIDGISSWWTVNHGHCNNHIASAIQKQVETLDHVIFANFSHENTSLLSQKIITHLPYLAKVFFSDNGSTSVEVAIKLAIQYLFNIGKKNKQKIVVFEDSYHGDTFGAMSVSQKNYFNKPFWAYMFEVIRVPVPTGGKEDNSKAIFENVISQYHHEITCFLYEPLVLGAGGMIMYSPNILNQYLSICKTYDIITIADEVMTGFGRTGKLFASDYLEHKPDIMCLSKGITGGILPLGVTVCNSTIHEAFISKHAEHTFYHGHSFTGNPISTAAAVANLELFDSKWEHNIHLIEQKHSSFKDALSGYKFIHNIRLQGTILAIEFKSENSTNYFNPIKKLISSFYKNHEVLLRPLGNVLYIMPPYCIQEKSLNTIYESIIEFIETNT